ncbi:thr operon leader peptide [Cronobacter malonaticus]|nr:thr operon leader peptide [Cronobacter malonaticus]ELY3761078.1 thr operon leader peptide [Cronobacter universalis]EGT4371536.1 thr operon leader peptide [Cronobacter malonaticus]EGT4385296.1 thr operon leader peptide [Cronobacter malonaticus]EGT4420398.1 thr operon leader peptide [Cronobacter malonaticus]EGT4446746.1 thr operon leader peptide [Cronobacter malonaticus]
MIRISLTTIITTTTTITTGNGAG